MCSFSCLRDTILFVLGEKTLTALEERGMLFFLGRCARIWVFGREREAVAVFLFVVLSVMLLSLSC